MLRLVASEINVELTPATTKPGSDGAPESQHQLRPI
jgi:hypothetical protein